MYVRVVCSPQNYKNVFSRAGKGSTAETRE